MADETQTAETGSDFPLAWAPAKDKTPGAKIVGKLVSVEVIDPSGKGAYPVVTLQTADGTLRALHAFHQVLRTEIAKRHPKIGDEITVTYNGMKEGGGYGGYHSYTVTGGQVQEMDWDAWLPEGQQQAPQQRGLLPNGTMPLDVDVPIATEGLPDPPARDEADDDLPF